MPSGSERRRLAVTRLALGHQLVLLLVLLVLLLARLLGRRHLRVQGVAGRHGVPRKPADLAARSAAATGSSLTLEGYQAVHSLPTRREYTVTQVYASANNILTSRLPTNAQT